MKKSIFLFFAAILCAMSVSAKVIYFKPNGNWAEANANFYAHVWGGDGATSPVKFTPVATDPDVYEAEIGTHNEVIFLRHDPAKTVTSSNMWDCCNRMGNISIPTDGKNCCTIKDGQWSQEKGTTNGAASYVTWSTYTPPTVVVIPDRYITGTLAGGWNANDVKMTYDEATETYSHTFTAVAANAEQKFKVTDGTWSKNWGGDAVSPAIEGVTKDGDGNVVFTLSTGGDVTVIFDGTNIQLTTTGEIKVAIPDRYIAGIGGWSETQVKMTYNEESKLHEHTFAALAAGDYQFKITDGTWTNSWGIDGQNYPFNLPAAGDVTIKYNWKDNSIELILPEVTEPEPDPTPDPAETETVYFVNAEDWTGTIYAYAWTDGTPEVKNHDWPGVAATKEANKIGGHDVYSYTAEKGKYAKVIFNNNSSNQTSDKTWTADQYLCKNEWCADEAAVLTKLNGPIEYVSVYFINTVKWSAVNIYTWSPEVKSWPGVAMTKETEQIGGFDVYSYTVEKGTTFGGMKFNENGGNQTGDLQWTDGKYYIYNYGEVVGWFTKEEAEAKLAAPVVNVYTVVGAEVLLGKNWDLNAAENEMQAGSAANEYTLVKTDMTIAKGTYEYKVACNHAWNEGQFPAEGNKSVTIEEDGVYNLTFTYVVGTDLKVELQKTSSAEIEKHYYVVGSFNGWNPADAAYEMALDRDVYKKEVTLAVNDEFKVCDGSWSASWGKDNLGGKTYAELDYTDDGNLKMKEAKTFTIIFNPSENLITFDGLTVAAPAEKHYYLIGTFNEWTLADANYELALVDGLYKKEVTLAKDAEFKVNQGDWDASWGKDNLGGKTYAELDYTDDGNLKMKEEKTFTVIFNLAANLITFTGLTETTPAVQTITYALMGVNGDWTTGITMTVNPDNSDEYVLKAQSISSTDAIKVLETAGSTQTWHNTVDAYSNATFELVDDGFGGKNIVLPAGTYNFYFKKINNEIYIEEVYVRDVTNTYGTICLPYASNSYDGAIFYRVAGKETGKVYLESVSELEAGVPYIFEKTASKIVVARNGDPVANAGNANGLVGTFTDETVVAAGNYILYINQLRPSDGSAKVNANRAYLVMKDVKGGKPTQMPGRRYIGMSVHGENEATGVEDLFTTDAPVKVIENGQLIIIRDGVKYNVQGQKL